MAGPGSFGAGHVLALNEDAEAVILRRNGAVGLQFLAHGDVQFAAGSVVGRDDQCVLGRFHVAPGDGADALFSRSGISFTRPCCWSASSAAETWPRGEQFDGGLERRVFLADDLIELGRAHSGFLQLLEGTARFDALMLADIADQKHAVIRDQAAQGTRASGWCWLGSIHRQDRNAFAPAASGFGGAGKEALQGSGLDACLIQLARGAGGRGETLDLIALRFQRRCG